MDYIITRTKDDPNTSLKHWKYIKRVKVNGKWRYYYDDRELKKFERGATDVTKTQDEHDNITNETTYEQTDKLFDSKGPTITTWGSFLDADRGYKWIHTYKQQGKISRSIAKAEKAVYDIFYMPGKRKKLQRNAERLVKKGKSKINKLLRKVGW